MYIFPIPGDNYIFVTNLTCDNNAEIEEAQNEFFRIAKSTDVTVMTCMLAISGFVGAVGNSIVILMCCMHPSTQATQSFILAMAVSDLIVCLMIIPYRVISYHVLITEVSCKFFEGLTYFTVFYSLTLLIAVAFERYFAVCKPLSFMCSTARSRFVILGLAMLALAFSVTAGLIAGHYVVLESEDNAKPRVCFTGICNEDGEDIRVMDPTGIMIYSGVLALVYGCLVPTVTVLYGKVFWVLHKRYGRQVGHLSTSAVHATQPSTSKTRDTDTDVRVYSIDMSDSTEKGEILDQVSMETKRRQLGENFSERASKKHMYHKRAAKILVLVTLAFVITYIPFLLMKLKLVDNIITLRLTFFLSSMINPIIYSFTNQQFRDNVRRSFGC